MTDEQIEREEQETRYFIPRPVQPPVILTPQPINQAVEQELVEDESEEVEVRPKPKFRDHHMSDLFEVPQPEDNDIYTDDLTDPDVDDLVEAPDDLFSVDVSDVFRVINRPRRQRRVSSRHTNRPINSVGRLRGRW